MRIHGSHIAKQIINPPSSKSNGASQPNRTVLNLATSSKEKVSDTVAGLISQLRLLPDVRPDIVADVKARLQSGEFRSPETVEKTAAAIFDLGR